ncbi:YadA-like family protein [Moraxella pluranimalium]|uniref:Uncharacterized protein n=1 Tax=Moraxella pluranimalium TaxID=470453 RepID=A0A1T0CG27_9GAMM|nr:YadA-like family protein [Moraxella pluranimalium]OOS21285.1 hypothetical protein B0680_10035 [Moraxella pluranimalium]
MNKAFKVIWNHATQSWTAVSEIARAKGKTKSVKTAKTALAVAVATAGIASASQAMAATTVEAAVAGGTTVTSTGESLYAATPIGTNKAFGDSVLIGKNSQLTTTAGGSVVLGTEASGGAISAVIGSKAVSLGEQDVVIGAGAQQLNAAPTSYSTVIGRGALNTAAGEVATAIGYHAETSAAYATAIGGTSTASAGGATAIGYNATASGGTSLAMGIHSNASASLSMALGGNSSASAMSASAIGSFANASQAYSVAFGPSANASATNAVAVGNSAGVTGESGTAVGPAAKSFGERAVAIGRSTWATGLRSTAMGQAANTEAGYSIAIGNNANVSASTATNSIAVGNVTKVSGANSVAVGPNNTVSADGTSVLGSNITATAANNVILGQNSSESSTLTTAGAPRQVDNATVGNLHYSGFEGTATGIVSVGATGAERQIINVAPGNISATSTDAINGSQLYATNVVLDNFYKSTVDALGGKVSPDTPNTANFTLSYNLTSNDPSNSTPDQVEYTSIGDALTALSQAVNQPLTFTANTNADTGANGTQQELGSSIAIIGSKTNKALAENTDKAVDSTYSAKNIQTVVTDNQVQIQMAENPEFKSVIVKNGDTDTNPVTITSGDAATGGTISNLTTVIQPPVGATETTAKPTTGLTNAATLGDVLNAGWNLKENGTAKDVVTPYDTVNFINGNGTTVTVTPSNNGASNEIKVDINLADPNLTTTVGDTTLTDGSTGTDGKIDTPAATDGDKLVNATTVVNAINASGWNVYQTDTTAANKKDTVNPGNNVVFKAGTNTTVSVDSDGTTTNVTYDIDLSKINDALPKTDLNVSTAPTATNNQTPTGKVETPAVGDATKLVNAGDIVEAINNSGFTLKSSATTDGTKVSGTDEIINPGDVVEMIAGKNMTVKQAANGTITYSTKDSVVFDNVNVTSKLPVTSINVGEKAAKTATDLLDLTTAAKNTPNAVVTAKDLANYGWVVATPDNGYDAAVKSANTVNFIGDNHISVTGANNATTGTYDVKIELANAGAISFTKDTTGTTPTNTGAVQAGDTNGNNPTGFVSAKTVADAINGSGWRTNSTTATGQATETLVNPGEQVNFEAGKNMVVTQKVEKDANGADVISYTYATADDVTFNSTTVGGNEITYTNAAGDTLKATTNPDGSVTYTDAAGNVVDPADVITKVENPITIGTVDGKNVISNLTSTLPNTTSVGDAPTTTAPNKADGTPFTAKDAQDLVNTAGNNAATLGDVLNAGWNLKVNDEAVDFVKPYDTVAFVNGTGTTARVESKDGVQSNITFDVNVDNKTTKITYVSDTGAPITKNADGTYSNADGSPYTGPVTSQITAVQPQVNGENVTGPVNLVNGDTTTVTNTPDGIKVEVNTGEITPEADGSVTGPVTPALTDALKAAEDALAALPDTATEAEKKAAQEAVEAAQTAINNAGNQVATAQNVADAINGSGWRTNSTTATGQATETLVNPGEQVNFEAGKNMVVTQKVEKDANGADVISYTYATADDVTFNSTTVGGNEITYTDKDGNPVTKNKAGDFVDAQGNVVDPAEVITNVANPITIGTVDGRNVISNLTSTLLSTSSFPVTDEKGTVTAQPTAKAPITAQEAAKIAEASGNNAATLGDVLNAGWNLKVNNEDVDFVKPYDTVAFVNGTGTTARVESKDGVQSNITFDVNVDDKTTKITYADASGNPLTQVVDPATGDITYTDAAGNVVDAADVVSQVSAVLPTFNNGTVAGNINFANSTTTNIDYNSTTGDVTVNVATGTSAVTDAGKATVTYTDKDGNPVTAKTNPDDGSVTYTDAAGNTVAADKVVSSGDKVATVGDIVNTINNVSWNAIAGKVAGSKGEVTGNASTPVKAGDTVTFNAGNNIKIEQNGATFNISTTENVSFTNVDVAGNLTVKGDTTVNDFTVNPNSTINMGGNVITNVAAGTNATDAVNYGQVQNITNNIASSLNWSMTGNNNASNATVVGNQTVSFNNGTGTTAVVDGTNVTYNVNVDNKTTEITYINAAGDTVYLQPDGTYNTAKDGSGTPVDKADVTSQISAILPTFNNGTVAGNINFANSTTTNIDYNSTTGDVTVNVATGTSGVTDGTTKDANGNTIPAGKATVTDADKGKVATVGDIVNTINAAGFTAAVDKTGTGVSKDKGGDSLVNAGDTVTLTAGDNVSITKDGLNYTIATSANATYTNVNASTVNAGDVNINNATTGAGTTLTTVAGTVLESDGKTAATANTDPTTGAGTGNALSVGGNQITHVANGAINANSTDAINGSQLYAVANNINNQLGDINNRIDDLDDNYRAGLAGAAAMVNIPQVTRPGANLVGVGLGHHKGESAIAVGFSSASDNERLIFKMSGTANTQGDYTIGTGMGWQW